MIFEVDQELFARIDLLIFLAAPDFKIVARWRMEQEQGLRARSLPGAAGVMPETILARFIQHDERLTRHILVVVPDYAALTIALDTSRAAQSPLRQGLRRLLPLSASTQKENGGLPAYQAYHSQPSCKLALCDGVAPDSKRCI